MGLDQYAFSIGTTTPLAKVDMDLSEEGCPDRQDLHYWRKHPNLQGWMERLYREQGGTKENFNCVGVSLSREDLDRLEVDIKTGQLPATSGFFFGSSDGSETESDLAFVTKARQALDDGRAVVYYSWW